MISPHISELRRMAALARRTKSGGTNGGPPLKRGARCPCGANPVSRARARWPSGLYRCCLSAIQAGTLDPQRWRYYVAKLTPPGWTIQISANQEKEN